MAESGSMKDIVARQMEMLQKAVAFNEMLVARLAHAEEAKELQSSHPSARPALQNSADDGGEMVAVKSNRASLICALQQRESYLGDSPFLDLREPLLPNPADPPLTDAASRGKQHEEGRNLFGDKDHDVKARVLDALQKPEYRVEALYKETSCYAALASNSTFQGITFAVIALNSLWIAVETDQNHAEIWTEAPLIFQIADNLFCAYFSFEIFIRFCAFKEKRHAIQDGWFVFDAILAFLMVWETWIGVALYAILNRHNQTMAGSSVFRIVRIFRFTRVARMGRLLRGIPELMILVKGMYEGIRSVSATMMLLVIIVYIFAVIFTQMLAGTETGAGCFDSVIESMNCLLLEGVFTEQAEFIRKLLAADWKYYVLMIVYLLFVSLTVMNMLIAVLCEVVSVISQEDKEETVVKALKAKILEITQSLGIADGYNVISKEHFMNLTHNPDAIQALHNLGVDVIALVELSDFIFHNDKQIPLRQFVEVILQFRGSNAATVKDIVDMRKFVCYELLDLEERLLHRARTP